jgi:hypothetical protein
VRSDRAFVFGFTAIFSYTDIEMIYMVLTDGLYDIAAFGAQEGNGFGGGGTRLLLLERAAGHAITRS